MAGIVKKNKDFKKTVGFQRFRIICAKLISPLYLISLILGGAGAD
jgi:hypothetical protein